MKLHPSFQYLVMMLKTDNPDKCETMLMQVRQRLVKVPVPLHYLNLICIPGLHVPTSNKLCIRLYILNDRTKLSAIMKPKRTQSSKREGMVLENET